MPIWEPLDSSLSINILGNFQDTVNTYNGAVRVFSMNRGEFNVRNCEWNLDLFEIGTGAIVETETVSTADSTVVTVDSTVITSDSTV